METRQLPDDDTPQTELTEAEAPDETATPEFRLIVRKLELPVRPRGVLAE